MGLRLIQVFFDMILLRLSEAVNSYMWQPSPVIVRCGSDDSGRMVGNAELIFEALINAIETDVPLSCRLGPVQPSLLELM